MFIGEMGCWMALGFATLFKRFIAPHFRHEQSPLLAGGYRPVEGEDAGEDAYHDDHIIDGFGTEQPHTSKSVFEQDTRIPLRGWRIFLLAAPSCCDIAGTTLMNVGLLFVAASVYQMTRGALVLFVGLFSVLFLRRKLHLYQWGSLFIVVLGVALVGLAGALFSEKADVDLQQGGASHEDKYQAMQTIVGVLLIAAAQIFTASQFVSEEWILENYAMDPLQVVGWEGVFGFSITFVGMIILYVTVGSTPSGQYGYFDIKEGWHQVISNRAVAISSILIMISIGYVILSSSIILTSSLTFNQWLQLFWPVRHPLRVCYFT